MKQSALFVLPLLAALSPAQSATPSTVSPLDRATLEEIGSAHV